jgi:hypothetical protein
VNEHISEIHYTLSAEEFLDTIYNGAEWSLYSEKDKPSFIEYTDKTGYYVFHAPKLSSMSIAEYDRFLYDVSVAVIVRKREERLRLRGDRVRAISS